MKSAPASIKQLQQLYLLTFVASILLLMLALGTSWAIRSKTQLFESRMLLLQQLLATPDHLLVELSSPASSGHDSLKTLSQLTDQWVARQEAIQTGSESLGIGEAAEADILARFMVIDSDFRNTVKAIRPQPSDEAFSVEEAIHTLRDFAPGYREAIEQIIVMWKMQYRRESDWLQGTVLLLILTTIGCLLLKKAFILGPIIRFLTVTHHRKTIIQEASTAQQRVIRDMPLTSQLSPGVGKKVSEPESESSTLADSCPADILIVEDHPANQKYILKLFEKLGYSADLASNGREAVEKALTKPYHLIFMDIQMPIMDGIQASHEILRQTAGQQQPVIVALTGSAEPEIQEQCLEVGMKDIIWKPVKRQQVSECILKWVGIPA